MVVQNIPPQRGPDSEQPLGGYQANTEDMEMHVNKVYKFFHRVLSVCDGDPFYNI